MKRLLMSTMGLFAFGLILLSPTDSFGFGCRRACRGCDPCVTAAKPAATEYVERRVTRYKENWVEKEVTVKVTKLVSSKEKYKYFVLEQVTKPETRKVTVYKQVMKDEDYSYTVCVPVMKKEKRKQVHYTRQTKEVDVEYTVMVPKTVKEKKKVTVYECQRSVVKETVPVCRLQRVSCVDECGRCCTRLERVTEMREVCRTVVNRVAVEREVEICRTICETEKRKGKKTVCEMIRHEKEVDVDVCTYQNETRKGTRKVCTMVAETRDQVCNVVSCQRVEREGERTVCRCVTEDVKRTVKVCQRVAYETTEKVAVSHGAATTCCNSGQGRFCGLLRGRGCGNCGGCR